MPLNEIAQNAVNKIKARLGEPQGYQVLETTWGDVYAIMDFKLTKPLPPSENPALGVLTVQVLQRSFGTVQIGVFEQTAAIVKRLQEDLAPLYVFSNNKV